MFLRYSEALNIPCSSGRGTQLRQELAPLFSCQGFFIFFFQIKLITIFKSLPILYQGFRSVVSHLFFINDAVLCGIWMTGYFLLSKYIAFNITGVVIVFPASQRHSLSLGAGRH